MSEHSGLSWALLAERALPSHTALVIQVPKSAQRLALEIEGWLDLKCPEQALEKIEGLFAVPGSRPTALLLRVRANVDLELYDQALADLDEIRAVDHDSDWADMTEAWCRKRMDDLVGATACMERLVNRVSHSAIGHFNLGCYLALMGKTQRALDEVALACGIDPSLRRVLAEEGDLQSLHGHPAFECLKDPA